MSARGNLNILKRVKCPADTLVLAPGKFITCCVSVLQNRGDHQVRCNMELKKYDGKPVSITEAGGDIYEGICTYRDREYCEHEFGRSRECLEIINFLFFPEDIRRIEDLETRRTAYGHFSSPYGKLEVMNVLDGVDGIIEQLYCEEEEHIWRLLLCLEDYPHTQQIDGLRDVLREAQNADLSDRCREKLAQLISRSDHAGME